MCLWGWSCNKRVMGPKERKQEEAWLKVSSSNKVLGRSKYSRQPQWLFSPAWLGYPPEERKDEEGFNPLVCLRPNILVPCTMNNVSAFQEVKAVLLVMIMACLSIQEKHQATCLQKKGDWDPDRSYLSHSAGDRHQHFKIWKGYLNMLYSMELRRCAPQ